jgi:hypothetical protein
VSSPSPVGSLLVVQQRRVDRALAAVTACNRQLREAQLQHDQAQASWQAADAQARAALDRRAGVVVSHLGQVLAYTDLLSAARSLEWWRACAAERAVQLEAARATMLQAQENAQRARRAYREADARREALMNLAEEQRKAQLQQSFRIQEGEMDERISAEFAMRLTDVA